MIETFRAERDYYCNVGRLLLWEQLARSSAPDTGQRRQFWHPAIKLAPIGQPARDCIPCCSLCSCMPDGPNS